MATGYRVDEVELRAMTNSQRMRESPVIRSSEMPSVKELLVGIAAHVAERQHRDRRTVRDASGFAAATRARASEIDRAIHRSKLRLERLPLHNFAHHPDETAKAGSSSEKCARLASQRLLRAKCH